MATDFNHIAKLIVMEIYVRANIDDHKRQVHRHDENGGEFYRVFLTTEDLKQIAGLQRMRKTYSNGKGGFYKRLIDAINEYKDEELDSFFAKEGADGSIVVILTPEVPRENTFKWGEILSKNTSSVQSQKKLIQSGDEDAIACDYRYPDWDLDKEHKLFDWEDYE